MNKGFDSNKQFEQNIRSQSASTSIFSAATNNDMVTLSRILTDLENAIQSKEERLLEERLYQYKSKVDDDE
jgi:hypothetical protein